MKKQHKSKLLLTIIILFLLLPIVATSSVSVGSSASDESNNKALINENKVELAYSIALTASKDKRKIESKIVTKYGEEVSIGNESDLFSTSKFQPIKPTNFVYKITVNKVDEKSVMVNTIITFNNHGEKVEKKPSIWVENGKNASINIKGDDYEIDLMVNPTF